MSVKRLAALPKCFVKHDIGEQLNNCAKYVYVPKSEGGKHLLGLVPKLQIIFICDLLNRPINRNVQTETHRSAICRSNMNELRLQAYIIIAVYNCLHKQRLRTCQEKMRPLLDHELDSLPTVEFAGNLHDYKHYTMYTCCILSRS